MSTPNTEQIKHQIEAYTAEQPHYVCYAETLKRTFETACKLSVPTAIVQSRAKDVSSFAEKCVRKAGKYKDPVHDLTDLCGARIIVQTLQQVKAVRQYIEANFQIFETDDKGLHLKDDTFGYRDMHYIIALRPDRDLGIPQEALEKIGARKAEVQIRTCVQHAWADTLHDRLYKTKLRLSPEIKRESALLAAIMEDGDRNFDQLAEQVDGMLANYTAHADRKDVENEIKTQQTILDNEPTDRKKPALTLNLAKLIAGSEGTFDRVIELLAPYAELQDPIRFELLLELGHARCRHHYREASGAAFRQGQQDLRQVVEHYAANDLKTVPDTRKRRGLLARALTRLGWSWTRVEGEEREALECYRRALECEPSNPYYLADILSFEINFNHLQELPASTRIAIGQTAQTCRQHALADIEMPYACFTAGRLHLLLGCTNEALAHYARGLAYCRAETVSLPCDVLETEIAWLKRVNYSRQMPESHHWVLELLRLSACFQSACTCQQPPVSTVPLPGILAPVMIAAGGAVSLDADGQTTADVLLKHALRDFQGTVISGGTAVGIPGCVGTIAGELGQQKKFRLLGYTPKALPVDAPRDTRYDQIIEAGRDGFTATQVLRNWADILAAGINPKSVYLVGIGGGPVSAIEYRVALAMGACVGIVTGTGGSAEALLNDALWTGQENLVPLPCDPQTLRAFLILPDEMLKEQELQSLAQEFHLRYVGDSASKLPPSMKPWPKLDKTFQTANIEQARYSVEILAAAGFGVRRVTGIPVIFTGFTKEDVERMSEMEHGRWNVERLHDGWRYASVKDEKSKLHNCLVPWSDEKTLTPEIKGYDREAVRKFPEILAKAGLEVFRK
jgi:ppGpp synthetase/RelA/SpoT-type nucleotidyltranferase